MSARSCVPSGVTSDSASRVRLLEPLGRQRRRILDEREPPQRVVARAPAPDRSSSRARDGAAPRRTGRRRTSAPRRAPRAHRRRRDPRPTALRSSRIALSRSPRRRHASPSPRYASARIPRSPPASPTARPSTEIACSYDPSATSAWPSPTQRRRIAAALLQRPLERVVRRLRLARRQPGLAEQDQRLAVVGLGAQQRLERIDRRGRSHRLASSARA